MLIWELAYPYPGNPISLFVLLFGGFMDRISRNSHVCRGIQYKGLELIFHQHGLEHFVAEYGAAGRRIRTSKSKAMVLS